LNRITYAFRCFFAILFKDTLPSDIAQAYGFSRAVSMPAAPAPAPQIGPADGAVQILSILQRDARLIDFLMEDISAYSDEQVGAAVRDVQENARKSMQRYLQLAPVIDGVEGTFVKAEGGAVKWIGNVPASGKAPGGTLRHKGWRAEKVELPSMQPGNVLAPAEIEVE
jgi:hypothetical protein